MNFMIPRTLKNVLASAVLFGERTRLACWCRRPRRHEFSPYTAEVKATAGSSSDTGKNPKRFVIRITQQPIVGIDIDATAVYIRLRDTKVVATKPYGSEKGLVMLDFDADENVVGIEVVGNRSSAFANSSNRFQ